MNLLEKLETTKGYSALRRGINRRLVDFLSGQLLAGDGPYTVAELACGTGIGSDMFSLQPSVSLSVGLDINTSMYQLEKNRALGSRFVVGDLEKAPFKKESFDLVWSSSSLEHFPDRVRAVRAMAELVKPGGHLFVGVPSTFGPLAIYFLTPFASWREWIGRPISRSSLEFVLKTAGLAPRCYKRYFFGCFIGIVASKI